ELLEAGKAGTPEYAELRRRFGFEYDGMRLHEYYFDNLKGPGELPRSGKFADAVTDSFGSVDTWLEDFKKTATMRGIGWVILYQDPNTGRLQNFWVSDHENG